MGRLRRLETFLIVFAIVAGCAFDPPPFDNPVDPINQDDDTPEPVYAIGDVGPAGGWIFYVDENDDFDWTYLEAAPEDAASIEWLSVNEWLNGESVEDGETQTGIGFGAHNTDRILHYKGVRDAPAAEFCDELEIVHEGTTYSDWFLPSLDELNAMYVNLHDQDPPIGGFTPDEYWGSSESSASEFLAWAQYFDNGLQFEDFKNVDFRVRAARAF